QLRQSRSYGPGRYDPTYEEQGIDYPIGYVRWTEQRNMQAFLDQVAAGRVQPARLVTHRVPIDEAERAYELLTTNQEPYLGILLEYPDAGEPVRRVELRSTPRPTPTTPAALGRRTVRLGVVGAGAFARSVLLPELKKLAEQVELRGVATASGPS